MGLTLRPAFRDPFGLHSHWRTLTDPQRAAWRTFAAQLRTGKSGFNTFVQINIVLDL